MTSPGFAHAVACDEVSPSPGPTHTHWVPKHRAAFSRAPSVDRQLVCASRPQRVPRREDRGVRMPPRNSDSSYFE